MSGPSSLPPFDILQPGEVVWRFRSAKRMTGARVAEDGMNISAVAMIIAPSSAQALISIRNARRAKFIRARIP